jgi:hypothetical protein
VDCRPVHVAERGGGKVMRALLAASSHNPASERVAAGLGVAVSCGRIRNTALGWAAAGAWRGCGLLQPVDADGRGIAPG